MGKFHVGLNVSIWISAQRGVEPVVFINLFSTDKFFMGHMNKKMMVSYSFDFAGELLLLTISLVVLNFIIDIFSLNKWGDAFKKKKIS